jgi:hypothetical protein
MEEINLMKLNEIQGKEQHQVKTANWSAALENLDDNVDNNRAWESITGSIKFQPK